MREVSNRDWFGKVSAGVICSYMLSLAVSGLFKFAVDAGPALYGVKSQVSIQLFSLIMSPMVGLCFLFPSTRSAWGWLGLVNGAAWGVVFLLGLTK